MAKCLIAGLPGAGKSTYIGALAYLLQNPVDNQTISYGDSPEDMSYLNKLSEPWLSMRLVDRTARGYVNSMDLSLIRKTDEKTFDLSIPDIAGEDFLTVLQKKADVIKGWSEQPDTLLLFINKWDSTVLAEEQGDLEPLDKTREPTQFTTSQMLAEVQNVLLLKELHNLFHFKRIAIGLSSWDLYKDDYATPWAMFIERSRFMYNFLMHYFPSVYVFGVSAQGAEYNDEDAFVDELMQKTIEGKRAYVVLADGTQSYDLTLPLDYLLNE